MKRSAHSRRDFLARTEHRGVSYWRGEAGFAPRLVFGTGDGRLIELNAKTGDGHLVPSAPGAPVAYRNESGYARFLDQDRSLFVAATNDSTFRAFDSRTGDMVWSARLDATGNATPMPYQGRSGKQYAAIVAGGPAHLRNVGDTSNDNGDSLIAFALSKKPVLTQATNGYRQGHRSQTCSACHGTETFANNRMTTAEWGKVVEDMAARGARGSADELRIVRDYLRKYLAKNG